MPPAERLPKEADLLVNAVEIGRRLDLSGERVRQLAKEGLLPAAVGRVGRNLVWRWDDVRIWAVGSGRLAVVEGEPARRAPRLWGEPDGPSLQLSVDEVFRWDPGRDGIVHVRVWQSSGTSKVPPVVVLGNLDDNRAMSVTNAVEHVAMAVASHWLGAQGLDAEWFDYWPPREWNRDEELSVVSFEIAPPDRAGRFRRVRPDLPAVLANPRWYPATMTQLERLVRGPVDRYQLGTYTAANVTRKAASAEAAIDAVWDPVGLGPTVGAVTTLTSALDTSPEAADVIAYAAAALAKGARVKQDTIDRDVAAQRRGVAINKVPVPVTAEQWKVIDRLAESGPPDLNGWRDGVMSLRTWLANHDEFSARRLWPGPLGLAWPERYEAGGAIDGEGPPTDGIDPLVAALRLAEVEASWWLWANDDRFAREDHPFAFPSSPMSVRGEPARRYLDTVAWWGPRAEDASRAERLGDQLEEGDDRRWGYDPWGRLVLRAGDIFVVEWPFTADEAARSLATRAVGTDQSNAHRPVFLELPDGRLDLLPAKPGESYGPDFTWGYSGAGPNSLAAALVYLCTGQSDLRRPASLGHRLAQRHIADLLADQGTTLDVDVAQVRRIVAGAEASAC